MKIYQFVSDSEDERVKRYIGQFCTGIMFCPGPFDFYSSVEELLEKYSENPKWIPQVEDTQVEEWFPMMLRFNDRPFMFWGQGNHQMVEVLDTKS